MKHQFGAVFGASLYVVEALDSMNSSESASETGLRALQAHPHDLFSHVLGRSF